MISWRILTYELCAADKTKVSEEENREVKEERDRPGSHDTDADKKKGHIEKARHGAGRHR